MNVSRGSIKAYVFVLILEGKIDCGFCVFVQ